jgi:hypothetical protein
MFMYFVNQSSVMNLIYSKKQHFIIIRLMESDFLKTCWFTEKTFQDCATSGPSAMKKNTFVND